MARTWFKAYDHKGEVRSVVWTSPPGAEAAERQALAARLARFELGWVDVFSEDPRIAGERLFPPG